MISSSIKVPTALTNGLGKSVEELIDGEAKITADGTVLATLKNVSGYTGFSDNSAEQKGHYFPVKLDDQYQGKTISCQRNSDPAREASDLEWILRVPSNATKFTFKADGEPILTLNFEKATLE